MPANLLSVSVAPLPDAEVAGFGPYSVLQSDPYKIGQLQYPLEGLGDDETPHYMTFNINIPTSSKYAVNNGTNSKGQAIKTGDNQSTSQIISKFVPQSAISGPNTKQAETGAVVTTLIGATQGSLVSSGVGSAAAFGAVKGITLTPKTQRITTAIHLYTPETLLVQYDQVWNEVSLTQALGRFGKFTAAGGKELMSEMASKGHQLFDMGTNLVTQGNVPSVSEFQKLLHFNSAAGAELAAQVAEQTGVAGPNFADLVLRSQNKAINPKNEMLFQGTSNRRFNFVFDFQPRSQKEAYQIYQIIRTFKAFAAPEYSTEGAGRYMIPPAIFDIGFFFKNAENLALPRISSCALVNISLDYNHSAPFATFNDGFPVHINMQMEFREIDIITRELIQKYGF